MIAFIDDHRSVFGVGPICRVLGIAPSTFYAFKAVARDPEQASDRARQDRLDMTAIKQAFDDSRGRYGVRISEEPDSVFAKSRTVISAIPGQFGGGWSLRCGHVS